VREALDNVHDAQRNGKILEVKLKWAEYCILSNGYGLVQDIMQASTLKEWDSGIQ